MTWAATIALTIAGGAVGVLVVSFLWWSVQPDAEDDLGGLL